MFSGIELHSSIGVGEKYHGPLRRVFLKVSDEHPTLDPATILRLALKGCYDTLGPNGLVQTLLVFGALPSLPTANPTLPKQRERMCALQSARREMEQITNE